MSSSGIQINSGATSVLFFIAVAVGVFIACLFILFSLRYFARARMGIFPGTMRIATDNGGAAQIFDPSGGYPTTFMQGGIYLDEHVDPDGSRRRRLIRRARRRRFKKKQRLSQEEVEHLFPERTYEDWLGGGADADIEQRHIHDELVEEDQMKKDASDDEMEQESDMTTQDKAADVIPMEELHFDSGSCAICLEQFEKADTVRGLICGHVFHAECIDPWLTKRKACCPMCKRDYYLKGRDNAAANAAANGTANGAAGAEGENQANGDHSGENNQQNDAASADGAEEDPMDWAWANPIQTVDERVAELASRYPELVEMAEEDIKRYKKWYYDVLWFILGIKQLDLRNSYILKKGEEMEAQRRQAEQSARETQEREQRERYHREQQEAEGSEHVDLPVAETPGEASASRVISPLASEQRVPQIVSPPPAAVRQPTSSSLIAGYGRSRPMDNFVANLV